MTGAPEHREFAYTERDFRRVQALIMARIGIHLGAGKSQMVYSRLARRLRATGMTSVSVYLDQLEDGEHLEWQNFINALTTNLTSFFRENHHFETLVEYFRDHPASEPLTVWCCAASTGEEPYSILIALREAFGPGKPVHLIATDVDTQALASARAGVYAMERVSKLSRPVLRKYFHKGRGPQAGMVRIKPELREAVEFRQVNLLDGRWPVEAPLDAIFCRNVFIYFTPETQKQLLRRFRRLLQPEGLFFAGHSESLISSGEGYHSLGRTVFTPDPTFTGVSS
ncbi:CheR family methyltransferase [Marinobacter zhanjiangensis]|uniref:Chemotaxis protein methyltransferase n=1 Tax=Marinobacter zhanjiangensis TaxID=578215 RepID=A0ABQ3AKG4_9GAMM|nr:CheR family methyltransferase [Marinobacter zhanjiangensis]GGY59949.1 chemotaxis protein methyltransferase [Marinobacter zhanjiangensis]